MREKVDGRIRKLILVVGMVDSIHLVRWLQQFENENLDFYIFASGPHRRVHPLLKSLLDAQTVATYRLSMSQGFASLVVWVLDRLFSSAIRGVLLRLKIRQLGPDIVHALELQNAGYATLRALRGMDRAARPTLIVTNYGSDIYWFKRFPYHRSRLEDLLNLADKYSCECRRDVELASGLGFTGQIMPVYPNAGGFSKSYLGRARSYDDQRHTIAIKGYQGWVGRAVVALKGIEAIATRLRDYEIEIYSCNRATIWAASKLRKTSGLRIKCWKKGALSHSQMMDLFGRAAVYVGISESDGISTSLLEAMACGAIPVQTSTACCDEWFTDTGVRVDTITPEVVGEAILTALELSRDPSNADRNRQKIAEKSSEEQVREAALQYYR